MDLNFDIHKNHKDHKSLSAKTFDENKLKIKASSPIQVIKSKK